MRRLLILRLLVVVWAVFCVRTGFTSWTDRGAPATTPVAISKEHPDGLAPIQLDFRCSGPLESSATVLLVSKAPATFTTDRAPCSPFRSGRGVLVILDAIVAVIAIAFTFAGFRRRLRPRFARSRPGVVAVAG